MTQIEGLELIGTLAVGLLLVYFGTRHNRKQRTREHAAAGDTAVSVGGGHDSSNSGWFVPWFGNGHDSSSHTNASCSSGDSGGFCGGDSGGDGGGGGGGD